MYLYVEVDLLHQFGALRVAEVHDLHVITISADQVLQLHVAGKQQGLSSGIHSRDPICSKDLHIAVHDPVLVDVNHARAHLFTRRDLLKGSAAGICLRNVNHARAHLPEEPPRLKTKTAG